MAYFSEKNGMPQVKRTDFFVAGRKIIRLSWPGGDAEHCFRAVAGMSAQERSCCFLFIIIMNDIQMDKIL